ncbi:MAG: DUF2301 domain-containing membrane protein [Kovacikia sp.]
MTHQMIEPVVYQGQFGEFTITPNDRQSVIVYRGGLAVAALCFAIGVGLVLWQGSSLTFLRLLTPLYTVFCLALGVSLLTIHIYLKPLHQALQVFLTIGCVASLAIAHFDPQPFALTVYNQPLSLFGVGFTFVALTGIFFKEAFCFNRLETKFLSLLVPVLLLGHLVGWMPLQVAQILLTVWAVLFIVFAVRKVIQPIPPDIGDKSVFAYLKQQQLAKANASHS